MNVPQSDTPEAAHARLDRVLTAELRRKVLPEAYVLEEHARKLHGDSIGAVLFYGSCQRAESAEGLLDLYLLSRSNRAFHRSAIQAGLNWLIPPNVYYYNVPFEEAAVRAKVAAISAEQFAQSCRGETPSSSVWARFCQPAVLLGPHDAETLASTVAMVRDAVLTAARWAAWLGPETGTPRDYWVQLFQATYRVELRPERKDRAALIYEAHAERYDQLLLDAWRAQGIAFRREDGQVRVTLDAETRRSAQFRWKLRTLTGKGLSLTRIAKATSTFDGGVDYLLWKIERHSGVALELTDWQRRHPFLAGPGVALDMLRKGAIR